jgi:Domain of unknown function (DUF932)
LLLNRSQGFPNVPVQTNKLKRILTTLLPEPKRPRNSEQNPRSQQAWEKKTEEIRRAKGAVSELRESGKGMQMDGSRGTFWGLLNAVLEYVDHHHKVKILTLASRTHSSEREWI